MKRWLIKYLSIYLSIYLSRLDADDFLLRGELIETFNILTGRPMAMEQLFFELTDTRYNLRGHSKRLTVNRCHLDSREYYFSNRVVHHQNNLTQEIVDARSVNVFNRGRI